MKRTAATSQIASFVRRVVPRKGPSRILLLSAGLVLFGGLMFLVGRSTAPALAARSSVPPMSLPASHTWCSVCELRPPSAGRADRLEFEWGARLGGGPSRVAASD